LPHASASAGLRSPRLQAASMGLLYENRKETDKHETLILLEVVSALWPCLLCANRTRCAFWLHMYTYGSVQPYTIGIKAIVFPKTTRHTLQHPLDIVNIAACTHRHLTSMTKRANIAASTHRRLTSMTKRANIAASTHRRLTSMTKRANIAASTHRRLTSMTKRANIAASTHRRLTSMTKRANIAASTHRRITSMTKRANIAASTHTSP